ncbi:MAG: hypothetical protein ABSE41_16035 [Bacteroidota bacterium]|jgi:hypothetical protein
MNHLTTNEVFQLVDETLANGARTKILAHLEVCSQCRQEVEFQRKLLRAAKSAPLVRPSADLRARVLNAVTPLSKKSLLSRIVNNLGSILAMGIVLTIVWYAGSTTNPSAGSQQPSILSEAVKTYVDYYARARDFISKKQVQLVGEAPKNTSPQSDNVLYLTFVSIIILVAVDRFVVRRFMRIRV